MLKERADKIIDLDATIEPGIYSGETIGPEKGLYRGAISQLKDERLTPSFFVYEQGQVKKIEIPEGQPIFHIGKGCGNEIVIDDRSISDVQVTVIQIGDLCYFMDCGDHDIVQFNGIQKRQAVISKEGRMVLRIGSTWVIYIGIDYHKYDESDKELIERSVSKSQVEDHHIGKVSVRFGAQNWCSTSAPILVGSHNSCDFRIDETKIAPFHFIVYFAPSGLFIEDISGGYPGIWVENKECHLPTPIHGDVLVRVEHMEINVYLDGRIEDQCHSLFRELDRQPGLMFTGLRDPNFYSLLPLSHRKLSVGRSADCDIFLDDPSVSRFHAFIMIMDKHLLIQDNGSANKTYVNWKPIHKTRLKPGDIVEMGDTCFLLHYQ